MTSKILNKVLPSRNYGDVSKLFSICLFVQVFFQPNFFLLLFSTSLSALSSGMLLVCCGLLGLFCFGLFFGWLGFCVCFFVCMGGFHLFFFLNFPLYSIFFFFICYCMVDVAFGLFCLCVHYKFLINKSCRAVNQNKYLGSGFLFERGL